MITMMRSFIKLESFGGLILVIMAIIALIICNTPLFIYYEQFLSMRFAIHIGQMGLAKPLILWINDGLMTIFFLLVGLEIKRELVEGELKTFSKAILPLIAALGGMICPAIIYFIFNYQDHLALKGWAIPTATDIAFALAVLALLRSRIPSSLKVFLTAVAILDDLGAILIIAFFYTAHLSLISLALALVALAILVLFNRIGITSFIPYALVGIVLWICVLESGVHATLAGVALALVYPLKDKKNPKNMPSRELETLLHPWVAYGVLPLFAFANAGLPLTGFSLHTLSESIPLGIMFGLVFGKQIGVFSASWLCIKLGIARMPRKTNWLTFYGVTILCGIGFTMSLFIGSLAFSDEGEHHIALVRIGVLAASVIAGIAGYVFLLIITKRTD